MIIISSGVQCYTIISLDVRDTGEQRRGEGNTFEGQECCTSCTNHIIFCLYTICKEGDRVKQGNLFTPVAQSKAETKLVSTAISN
jgi:hypothetical protein